MPPITLPADIAADVSDDTCDPWICMKLLWQHDREAFYLQYAVSLRHTADDWLFHNISGPGNILTQKN